MRNKIDTLIKIITICILLTTACSNYTTQITATTAGSGAEGGGDVVTAPIVEKKPPAEPADILFHNGNIITIEQDQPLAQAVAIRGNLIQAVGTNTEVMAFQGSDTILVDLKGKTLLPGFINNHTHYLRNGWGSDIPLDEMQNNFLRYGYTSETELHSIDDFINAMLAAEQKGEIKLRLNIYGEYNCGGLGEDRKSIECPSWYLDHDPILDPARMVRIPGVKIFMDGAGTRERGCSYNSFDFPSTVLSVWPDVWDVCTFPHGDLYLDETRLTRVLGDIQARGYRAAFHAMGDASIDVILNSIETVLNGESNLVHRHEILHDSLLRPDQLERYRELNILAQFGGMFNVSEADWYVSAFGQEGAEWAANRYALPGMGVHVSFGNDYNGRGDIRNLNPFRALYGYVTHKEQYLDGTVYDPPQWVSKHAITVQRALELMTIEGAFAVSMEDHTGSLKPGKFADLIIISGDPLTIDPDELINLEVYMTMVNGSVKFCAPGQEGFCPAALQAKTAPESGAANTPSAAQAITDPVQTYQMKFNCDQRGGITIPIDSQLFLLTTLKWAVASGSS